MAIEGGRRPTAAAAAIGGLGTALRDALLITLLGSTIGVLANLVHPEHVPFFAGAVYEVLVPCPEPGGDIAPVEADDPLLLAPGTILVDARGADQHAARSLGDAMNVPYDYLDPTPPEVIAALARNIARSRAQRVVVYGDGDTPDTGEQLGKEISASGIKNVLFVRGGAPALERAKLTEGGK